MCHICVIIHQFTSYSNDNLISTRAEAHYHNRINFTLYTAPYVIYPLYANTHTHTHTHSHTHCHTLPRFTANSQHLHLFHNSCIIILYILVDSLCLIHSSLQRASKPASLSSNSVCVCVCVCVCVFACRQHSQRQCAPVKWPIPRLHKCYHKFISLEDICVWTDSMRWGFLNSRLVACHIWSFSCSGRTKSL